MGPDMFSVACHIRPGRLTRRKGDRHSEKDHAWAVFINTGFVSLLRCYASGKAATWKKSSAWHNGQRRFDFESADQPRLDSSTSKLVWELGASHHVDRKAGGGDRWIWLLGVGPA